LYVFFSVSTRSSQALFCLLRSVIESQRTVMRRGGGVVGVGIISG
jgi:hypothetical protein